MTGKSSTPGPDYLGKALGLAPGVELEDRSENAADTGCSKQMTTAVWLLLATRIPFEKPLAILRMVLDNNLLSQTLSRGTATPSKPNTPWHIFTALNTTGKGGGNKNHKKLVPSQILLLGNVILHAEHVFSFLSPFSHFAALKVASGCFNI